MLAAGFMLVVTVTVAVTFYRRGRAAGIAEARRAISRGRGLTELAPLSGRAGGRVTLVPAGRD